MAAIAASKARVAELVDAADSKSAVRKDVLVRFQSRALYNPCKSLKSIDLQGFFVLSNLLFHSFYRFLPLLMANIRLTTWRTLYYLYSKILAMTINISPKPSRSSKKIWYYFEWGKTSGQRRATGIFTWAKPVNQIEKNHNKEALAILETKRSQLVLDRQAINS